MSLLTTRNTYIYIYINILYFYSWRWYLCGAEKQLLIVRAHEGVVGRRKSQSTTDFSGNSGTYIVYNSHVTCSNSSFSLTMFKPISHFFAFYWLCCLLPIGYLPKPGSVGVRICHHHRIQPRPRSRWYSYIFGQIHLFQHPLIHSTCGHGDISTVTLSILSLAGCSCLNILHSSPSYFPKCSQGNTLRETLLLSHLSTQARQLYKNWHIYIYTDNQHFVLLSFLFLLSSSFPSLLSIYIKKIKEREKGKNLKVPKLATHAKFMSIMSHFFL